MKILLTTHQFFPKYTSGTEVLTLSVAKNLTGRGHEVHVLAGHPSEKLSTDVRFDEYLFEGIQVYRFHHTYAPTLGQTSTQELSYDNHLATQFFAQIIEKFKPDIVHFFHLNLLGTGLIDQAEKAGIPAFMTPTDFWTICPTSQLLLPDGSSCQGPSSYAGNCVKHFAQSSRKGILGKTAEWLPITWADRLVYTASSNFWPPFRYQAEIRAIRARLGINIKRLNQLNGIVAPSHFLAKILVKYGVSPTLITQSAYGIDVAGKENIKPRPPLLHPLRIGFIGTLASHKGCHVLIEALRKLALDSATLKIYGDQEMYPDYVQHLVELAESQSNIQFCGVFPNSMIAEIFNGLDILVVPSIWYENTPLVLYSAQAASCPVLASDLPGLSEVIQNEKNGLLFEAGNVAALEKQLLRCVNEAGLVEYLSINCQLPKSTSVYVDDLLSIWESI